MADDACVFCEIVGDQNGIVAFKPLNPVVPGHLLFVPATHVKDASSNPDIAGQTFAAAASWGAANYPDFNLITSAGHYATQTVWHLHVHYVPRHPDDGLHLPWTGQLAHPGSET